jgi:hypothetical protein
VVDPEPPVLDVAGLLRHRGRWIAITDAQLPVVALLVRNRGRLTRNEEILDAYASAGGSSTRPSLRSLVHRLRCRLSSVGLELHVVPRRGVVLDARDVGWTDPEG